MSDNFCFEHIAKSTTVDAKVKVHPRGQFVNYSLRVETMANRIRHLRTIRGYSQAELGEKIGVPKQTVSSWENGTRMNMRLPTFLLLCEALATNPDYLVYGPNAARRRRPRLLPDEKDSQS